MNIPGLKIRWINYACYEIVLPNGTVIIVDPCIDYTKQASFTSEQFTGVDVILLSHTHYDHTMEVGYLEKKFKSKVFVGTMSAFALAEFYDIQFDRLYPVSPNERFVMEEFTLEVFRSKHTFTNSEDAVMSFRKEKTSPYFPQGHQLCDLMGSIEYLDYLITTKENLRILICGGGPYTSFYQNMREIAKEKAPNIVLRQSSSKYTPEQFAEVMNEFHPQCILPLHQDGIIRKTKMSIQEYVDRANLQFAKMNASTRMINPPQYQWITISMQVKF